MERRIRISAPNGRIIAVRAYLDYEDWDFEPVQEEAAVSPEGELSYDDDAVQTARFAIVVPQDPGYWVSGLVRLMSEGGTTR